MSCLEVSQFSCIKNLSFELKPITVIIGKQGAGKSVLTKLHYFISSIPYDIPKYAQRRLSMTDYNKLIVSKFIQWFPPSAWGSERFKISFSAGPFHIRFLRRRIGGELSDEISIRHSEWFNKTYNWALELFEDAEASSGIREGDVLESVDRNYELRDKIFDKIANDLAGEIHQRQNFIPAGRAFFTSIGKLVAGIEAAGNLDPVTTDFARTFAQVRDIRMSRSAPLFNRLASSEREQAIGYMKRLFDGEIRSDSDTEVVHMSDGRRVPFSALSSGQQEMIPIWYMLELFLAQDDATRRFQRKDRTLDRRLVYIEEPEAHLFPSAQSSLSDLLFGLLAGARTRRDLIVTTHSPYILSKVNIFLKAGQIAKHKEKRSELSRIVPRDCWINPSRAAVISIQDGTLVNIIDEITGLIDGDFLDSISGDIDETFGELLDLEYK